MVCVAQLNRTAHPGDSVSSPPCAHPAARIAQDDAGSQTGRFGGALFVSEEARDCRATGAVP